MINEKCKHVILNKKQEFYDCKNDCFVKDFNKNCLCDRKVAEKYSGNYDYYILTTSENTTNIRVVKKDDV